MVGVFGIVLSLVLLMYLAYRGINVLILMHCNIPEAHHRFDESA